jgi:hypothetical protein
MLSGEQVEPDWVVTRIRRGEGSQSKWIYAELRRGDGSLVIAATLDFILEEMLGCSCSIALSST